MTTGTDPHSLDNILEGWETFEEEENTPTTFYTPCDEGDTYKEKFENLKKQYINLQKDVSVVGKVASIEETIVTVDEWGCIEPSFRFGDLKPATGGYLKYLPVKEGTRVRVRLEILEEDDL